MPIIQPLTPGVYREDIFPTPAPVLPTGVPVFIGWTESGTANQPQQLTLWTQFGEQFGHHPQGYLASAVRGFFSNGGRICHVVSLQKLPPTSEPEAAMTRALKAALEAIAPVEDVDLVCVPDLVEIRWTTAQIQRMQAEVLAHCDAMGDRFAILDSGKMSSVSQLLDQQKGLVSPNGALYAPWILTEQGDWVPPCGHVAGIYARSDRDGGVHYAPANLVLEDVLDLSYRFSTSEQAVLNAPGNRLNYLRVQPGRGIRVWGARTLSREPDWLYINVRRLVLTVGRWIERNLANVAFEPNDFRLWVRIERDLTAYLETLALQGAFKGETLQESFYVKCDAENNPPEVRDDGRLITEIGLAPTQPNEFIIVRLIHGDTGVTLSG